MKRAKEGLRYILIFLFTLLVLTSLLVLSAKIPKNAIRSNIQASAEYLCDSELFGTLIDNVNSSKIDHYADSILLGIAYQYDAKDSLRSVMTSSYYYDQFQNENENLLDAISYDKAANQQYLRYWHGSIVILRPLLVFFQLKEIYIVLGVLLALLTIWLFLLLLKQGAIAPAIGFLLGLVETSAWFVPFSLEYTWVYLLMVVFSIIGIKLVLKENHHILGVFFLICGMLTNYLDFLTTETITLLVPLLFILWFDKQKHPDRSWKYFSHNAGSSICLWSIGYIGMWVSKWLLSSCILGENVMPYVTGHIEERLGYSGSSGALGYMFRAISRNISCLFPLEYGEIGVFVAVLLIFVFIYIGYVYHRKNMNKKMIGLYLFLSLIPYIRYMVLRNHSYLHHFFTYRAQIATILALILVLEEMTDWRWQDHGHARKC